MDFPDFFAATPPVTLRDPLAAFLGASKSGVMTYSYTDAVKLAGHSCPTVACAYLMVRRGLGFLYRDELPERGGVEVYLRDGREQGATGVIAAVATLITGAAPETGFDGLGASHRFSRRDLLHFEAPIDGALAMRRRDNGRGVALDVDMARVPSDPAMGPLFTKALTGQADGDEQSRFAALFQGRVARMLLQHADDPTLIQARGWEAMA